MACGRSTALQLQPSVSTKRILSSTTHIDKGRPTSFTIFIAVPGSGFLWQYSFRYLWQKRLHFWSYSHHPFYLQRGAFDVFSAAKEILSWPKRRIDVSSRNRVSLKSDFSRAEPPSSVSEATNQPLFVTASKVAGDFSSPVVKAGACTSKRTGSPDGKLSTNALRSGSGASETVLSLVGKRVSISILYVARPPFKWRFRFANRQSTLTLPAAEIQNSKKHRANSSRSHPILISPSTDRGPGTTAFGQPSTRSLTRFSAA